SAVTPEKGPCEATAPTPTRTRMPASRQAAQRGRVRLASTAAARPAWATTTQTASSSTAGAGRGEDSGRTIILKTAALMPTPVPSNSGLGIRVDLARTAVTARPSAIEVVAAL